MNHEALGRMSRVIFILFSLGNTLIQGLIETPDPACDVEWGLYFGVKYGKASDAL